MAKTKEAQVSMTNIDAFIKISQKEPTPIAFNIGEGKELIIDVKYTISADDMVDFCDAAVDALYQNNRYIPVAREFVITKCILAYYTNMKIDLLSNERLLALHYDNEFMPKIRDIISLNQLDEIEIGITKALNHKLSMAVVQQEFALASASQNLETIINTMSGFAEKTKDIDIRELMSNMTAIASKDEKQLVSAVLDRKIDNVVSIGG